MLHRCLALCSLLLFTASTAAAAPPVVQLYPDGARVQVEETAHPSITPDGATVITFVLPSAADPATFLLDVPGREILGMDVSTVPAVHSSAKAALLAKRDALLAEIAQVQGARSAVEARMGLWSGAGQNRAVTPADLERVDALMAKHLRALQQEKTTLDAQEKDIARRLGQVEADIARMGGGETAPRIVVRISGAASAPLPVTYVYDVSGCGWSSAYRLDAHPDKGVVGFTHEAVIRQAADLEWKGVRLSVASSSPDGRLEPPPVGTWVIRPREPMMATQKLAAQRSAAPMMAEMASADMASAPPREEDHAGFSVWDLGVRDLMAGEPVRVPLGTEEWKADFHHTLRPARDDHAYLSATVNLPEARAFPQGTALHLVDGASVGEAPFDAAGADLDLFFGSDPRVTGKLKAVRQQSGKTGVIDRKQTRVWAWEMEIRNGRTRDVKVRVEDPAPQSADAAVIVTRTSTPEPQEKDHVLRWELTVPAGAVSTIRHDVEVVAPVEMLLVPGR